MMFRSLCLIVCLISLISLGFSYDLLDYNKQLEDNKKIFCFKDLTTVILYRDDGTKEDLTISDKCIKLDSNDYYKISVVSETEQWTKYLKEKQKCIIKTNETYINYIITVICNQKTYIDGNFTNFYQKTFRKRQQEYIGTIKIGNKVYTYEIPKIKTLRAKLYYDLKNLSIYIKGIANFTGYCKYGDEKYKIYENQYFIIPYKSGVNYLDCGRDGVFYFVENYDISQLSSIVLRNLFSIIILAGILIVIYLGFGWLYSIYTRYKEKYKSAREELEEKKR